MSESRPPFNFVRRLAPHPSEDELREADEVFAAYVEFLVDEWERRQSDALATHDREAYVDNTSEKLTMRR